MTTKQKPRANVADWRLIANDREKYAAYLCSREWAVLKESVRERSGGKCERCKVLPQDATHHLTYERKYAELLEDLQATCDPCHEFTHGKSSFDPRRYRSLLRYLTVCRCTDVAAVPLAMLAGCHPWDQSSLRNQLFSIKTVYDLDKLNDPEADRIGFSEIAYILQESLDIGFDFVSWLGYEMPELACGENVSEFVDVIAKYATFGEFPSIRKE